VGIRLVVVDDNPHVLWEGRVYPVNATFHRFLAALFDIRAADGSAPIAEIVHCVPLRDATAPPETAPLDARLRVVATAPFDGIAGYLRHGRSLSARNRPILRGALRHADLVMLKLPASNAALAAGLARRADVPVSSWVAGSAARVALGRWRGPAGMAAGAIGLGYDLVGRAATAGGARIFVGRDLVRDDGSPGDGIVASLVEPSELTDPVVLRDAARAWPAVNGRIRLAWAGRVVAGKGLEAVIDALALAELSGPPRASGAGPRAELLVLGDGPARDDLSERAISHGVADQVTWAGHIADRRPYLAALSSADAFVLASPSEGFPKAVLDAMAVGLPVLATPAGELKPLVRAGLIAPIEGQRATDVAASVAHLSAQPDEARRLALAGAVFAAGHTRPAEATRLVERWRIAFPALPWAEPPAAGAPPPPGRASPAPTG
jgi:glycosyltransferase involved in cell wall biosynthesis